MDVWCLVQSAFENGTFDASIAENLIVLIPKVTPPTRFQELHPISLCNVMLKLITKVLVHCITPFLDEIVGPF